MKKEAFYSESQTGTIDLSRLKKNVHGEFHNDVLEKAEQCEAIRQYLAPQLQAYKEAVKAETDADFVNLEPPVTEELLTLTGSRDKVQTGFKSGARALMEMDDPQIREAATVLFELTHKHDLHTNMNMDAQTDAIRDFVSDVKENHLELVSICGLTVLFNKLNELNEQVCELQKERFVIEAEKQRGVFAEARKATDEAYKELIRGVNAYGYVYGTAQFAPFISFLNSIIIYYRRVHLKEKVNASTGDNDGETGSEETPNDPSTPNNPSNPSDPNNPSNPNNPGNDNQEPVEVKADFMHDDGSEENLRGEPGTPLNAPEPDPGYEWEPTPPSVFPDHDTVYREVEIDNGEGDGDDDAGFGR